MGKQWSQEQLFEFLDSLLYVEGRGANSNDIRTSIDALSHLVDLLRWQTRHYNCALSYERFVQGYLEGSGPPWRYVLPEKAAYSGSGTPPIKLQPELLLFLLLHHKRAYSVYNIITLFINRLHDSLSILDSKRTRTGVMRCFTNTRFAANTLREFGLLRYSQEEAYKTWVLSLPGFVVGAHVLKLRLKYDGAPLLSESKYPPLHEEVLQAWNKVQWFEDFIGILSGICEPNVEVFKSFKSFLEHAYRALNEYWAVINNVDLSGKKRQAMANTHIELLQSHGDALGFHEEFSKCLNVEALLSQVYREPAREDEDDEPLYPFDE